MIVNSCVTGSRKLTQARGAPRASGAPLACTVNRPEARNDAQRDTTVVARECSELPRGVRP